MKVINRNDGIVNASDNLHDDVFVNPVGPNNDLAIEVVNQFVHISQEDLIAEDSAEAGSSNCNALS